MVTWYSFIPIFIVLNINFIPTKGAHANVDRPVVVLAASSIADSIRELLTLYEAEHDTSIVMSSASSGTLAQQIVRGAPAHIFISASSDWTNQLLSDGYLNENYSQPYVSNSLLVVGPNSSARDNSINSLDPRQFISVLGNGRLAIGNPAHVPAGKYAKQYFQSTGLWDSIKGQVAMQSNVRAVLTMVERGEAPLGIVYYTDIRLSKKVSVFARIPNSQHSKILYVVSMTSYTLEHKLIPLFYYLTSVSSLSHLENAGFIKLN